MDVVLTADQRVRILWRMARMLEGHLRACEQGRAGPEQLGLTALLAEDLDRHVTALIDERYAAADDGYIEEIERTVQAARAQLGTWDEVWA